jgi:hypothetical protein
MKKLIYYLFVFGLSHSAFSQERHDTTKTKRFSLGISGGYVYNSLHSSTNYRAFTKYTGGKGLTVSVPVRYELLQWLAVQAEPQYIQKNYGLHRTQEFSAMYNDWTNSYLQLPLFAQFSFGGKKLRGFVNVGGFVGWWAASNIQGSMSSPSTYYENPYALYTYNEKYPFIDERDRRMEAGVALGGGVRYNFDRCTPFVEMRYYRGLTDTQKDYMLQQTPRYNDTYSLQVGILFTIL